LVSCARFPFSC